MKFATVLFCKKNLQLNWPSVLFGEAALGVPNGVDKKRLVKR
jgi:hypothetical protein